MYTRKRKRDLVYRALVPIWPLLVTFLTDFDQAAMNQTARAFVPQGYTRKESFYRDVLTLCVNYTWSKINFSFHTLEVRLWQDSYQHFYADVPFLSMFISYNAIECAGHRFLAGKNPLTFRWK